ncbi:UNVERIFIED_CONTAM: hypothetical protein FKN15_072415 [Acipenser sinensis]
MFSGSNDIQYVHLTIHWGILLPRSPAESNKSLVRLTYWAVSATADVLEQPQEDPHWQAQQCKLVQCSVVLLPVIQIRGGRLPRSGKGAAVILRAGRATAAAILGGRDTAVAISERGAFTAMIPGDPRRSRIPGDPRRSRIPGDPRRSRIPGDPRRSRIRDDPRRSRIPGDPRRSKTLDYPRRSRIPGDPRRRQQQRTLRK